MVKFTINLQWYLWKNSKRTYIAGKHQASSPIDVEQSHKKQREDSDSEELYMSIAPSPKICMTNNIPMESNTSHINLIFPVNTQSTVSQQTTSSCEPSEKTQITGVENHEHSQVTPEVNQS